MPATQKYVRHRDIWDLAYLSQERAVVRSDLVAKKIKDYRIEDYKTKLDAMITSLLTEIQDELDPAQSASPLFLM